MSVAIPGWWGVVAWVALGLGIVGAAAVAADILVAGHRQRMPIMNAVWPITALYFGPAGVWAYRRLGRSRGHADGKRRAGAARVWHGGLLSASHCGAGCVVGDIVGGWIIFATGWTVAGERLYGEYVAELVLAWIAGIAFQYFSIAPARPELPARRALAEAIKADTLSIVAFEVGMFAWMALATLIVFRGPVPINGPVFWFMMQIGLILGFATTYPVNRWLVRVGIKQGM